MSNLTSQDIEPKVDHKEVAKLMKAFRTVDSFMFNGQSVKSAIQEAIAGQQEVGLVVLDCVSAFPVVGDDGWGKISYTDTEDIVSASATLYQQASIQHLLAAIKNAGLTAKMAVVLGTDDFVHSVAPSLSTKQTGVSEAIQAQVNHFIDILPATFGENTYVLSWLDAEASDLQIAQDWLTINEQIHIGWKESSLDPKIIKRLSLMIKQRADLLGEAVGENNQATVAQAIAELTSFIVQAKWAPTITQGVIGNIPIIFLNPYPDLHTQGFDDICMAYGWSSKEYGIVHLPGPERFAKFTKTTIKAAGKVLTCGDPKGNPNY